ncbi:MAG TPA: UDP-3-O-(3-hydroxymyristoyl)glucosamine N-acyltransferase [Gammaproteobacteria bacterium]|nr:UDP-3-O-(3-hydroxymyristoyl)glucosamine N-acyltransferase [Gammaproteobacteria bacterium]
MAISNGDLAKALGLPLQGDPGVVLDRVAPLDKAGPSALSFLVGKQYLPLLKATRAGLVILPEAHAGEAPGAVLVSPNPYLDYARAARLLFPVEAPEPGIHPGAVVAESAKISPTASIGPGAVIGERARIAEAVVVGAGAFIGDDVVIGEASRIDANAAIYRGVQIGKRCHIASCAVIGGDGFGYANDQGRWVGIPQVGSVRIGDDVDIGANTTIDRGAIEDTVIGDGVKLDNLIQIAHNVVIGEHTAIAGCTGIAGSATIGKYCTIGGAVNIVGHLRIADHTTITGQTFVANSIDEPGVYSSGVPMQANRQWRRNYARFKQLDELAKRIRQLEKQLEERTP